MERAWKSETILMKILIVDDSMAMRKIVARTLRQAGFDDDEIVEAEHGQAGLEAVTAHSPDVILSDWNMPVMNGIDFLKALRAADDTRPFGFITTEGGSDMRRQAIEAGADFLLEKPCTAEQVASKLSQYAK